MVEDFGESALAERHGIRRYPAIFVDDVLIAKPKDFGFFGKSGSQGAGRYTPWRNADSQARFAADLERCVRQALAGRLQATVDPEPDEMLAALPAFERSDLAGIPVTRELLLGRVSVVEFWATWCPPCLDSIPDLAELQERHGEDLQVLGIAVESREEEVRRLATELELPFPVVLGDEELARAFGDLLAVPTILVFDRRGRTLATFQGAPEDLGAQLEAVVTKALAPETPR